MSLWEDRNKRERSHATIQDSVATTSSDQKQWLFAVFNVIRSLSANGLPLRGDTESDIESGGGLFMRAFSQLLFPLDPKWKEIHRRLPNNTKYTSHEIQNEIISILATLVKKEIAKEIKEADLFTIMADGTTDKNRKEIQGLICRYWTSIGKIDGHCLNIKGVDDRSANGIFQFIKETLAEYDIGTGGIVLISQLCQRYILYIHCFLHRINLGGKSINDVTPKTGNFDPPPSPPPPPPVTLPSHMSGPPPPSRTSRFSFSKYPPPSTPSVK